jgi:AcrR family transcriptional regulator
MRGQVAAIAVGLFLERGYDATTVDDICAAAEISRSTFFRYFATKEDALFGMVTDTGRTWVDALATRPAGEHPWAALRHALGSHVAAVADADENAKRLIHLIMTTPALIARHREKNAYWQRLLRPEVARRLGAEPSDPADPRPDALIAAVLGALDAALVAWTVGGPARPLTEVFDEALAAINPLPEAQG